MDNAVQKIVIEAIRRRAEKMLESRDVRSFAKDIHDEWMIDLRSGVFKSLDRMMGLRRDFNYYEIEIQSNTPFAEELRNRFSESARDAIDRAFPDGIRVPDSSLEGIREAVRLGFKSRVQYEIKQAASGWYESEIRRVVNEEARKCAAEMLKGDEELRELLNSDAALPDGAVAPPIVLQEGGRPMAKDDLAGLFDLFRSVVPLLKDAPNDSEWQKACAAFRTLAEMQKARIERLERELAVYLGEQLPEGWEPIYNDEAERAAKVGGVTWRLLAGPDFRSKEGGWVYCWSVTAVGHGGDGGVSDTLLQAMEAADAWLAAQWVPVGE